MACWRDESLCWGDALPVEPRDVPVSPDWRSGRRSARKAAVVEEVVARPVRKRKGRRKSPERLLWERGVREWALLVRARDGRCKSCGSRSRLVAHHVWPKADYPELAFELWNGVTLCRPCHRLEHMDLPDFLFEVAA